MKIFCKSVSDGLRRRVGGRRIFPCVRVVASFSGLCVSGSVPFADRSRTGRVRSARRRFPGKGERGGGRFPARACEASGVLGGCDRRERSGRLGPEATPIGRKSVVACSPFDRPGRSMRGGRCFLSAGPGIRTSFRFAGRGRREKYGFASCYAPERNAGTRCRRRRKRALS